MVREDTNQGWDCQSKKLEAFLKDITPPKRKNYILSATDRQHNIWLRYPLAIKILHLEMLVQKLDYMYLNPMQPHWLLCNQPAGYKFSSAIFYERQLDEFGILTNFNEVF